MYDYWLYDFFPNEKIIRLYRKINLIVIIRPVEENNDCYFDYNTRREDSTE